MSKKSYYQLLKDPRWQKKRLEILQRDEFKCLICKDSETELQIHHLSYSGEPWEVENDQLKTLCAHCHAEIEHTKQYWKENFIQPEGFEFFINRFDVTKYISNNWTVVVFKLKTSEMCAILEFNNKDRTSRRVYVMGNLKVYNSF